MDYKEAYYSLIERLKEAKEDEVLCDERYCCVIDGLIQEQEENERIRKAISQCVEDMRGQFEKLYSVHHKDALDWLAKQGIKPQGKSALEAAKEEKVDNSNKVERKFKVGDFIANDYCKGRVIELTADAYLLDTGQGIPFSCEHNAHLWKIQEDAKEGDVLYLQHDGEEHIIIYKGVIKEKFRTFISAYCAYNSIVDAFCFADVSKYADIAYGGIMPATKEQKEFLFKRMKEEGYKWNAGRKELSQIDVTKLNDQVQKSIWSEADDSALNNIIDTLVNCRDGFMSREVKESYNKDIAFLNSLKERLQKS